MDPKRPPPTENPDSTVVLGADGEDEDLVSTGKRRVSAPEEEQPNDGATAFVRLDAVGPPGRDEEPPAEEANDGATAFVRVDKLGGGGGKSAAPLPDATALDQPSVEDPHDGATAMVRLPSKPKPASVEVEPPRRKQGAEPEAYNPVAADDYGGHLSAGPPAWKLWLRRAIVLSVAFFLLGTGALVAGYVWISREIPAFESIRDYRPFVSTKVVTQDGTAVGQFFREKRTLVRIDQIPHEVVQALVAAEDKDFYKHSGINVVALARATIVNLLSGRKRFGASTITQQAVKNMVLKSGDKKLKRKLKEILLAWRLEKNLSKDDILYLYLNDLDFGKGHYGVEEASLYYFGKHVGDLDLGEAALMAGLPQNPSRLNPRKHPENAKRRQRYVLDRMLANKVISKDDHDREAEKPLALAPTPPPPVGGWYLDEVRRQLIAQFGEGPVETAGWTVEVAMDPRLQAFAEAAVADGLRAVDKRQGWRGAIFKIDAAQINDYQNALGRRLGQMVAPEGSLLVADLDAMPEKEQASVESIARNARLREVTFNGVYAGVVTAVTAAFARVLLAPGVEGVVPFSTMAWARPFKPESHTPLPTTARDVVSVGDVVQVRVRTLQLTRASATAMKARAIDFSLEQAPEVQAGFAAIDLKTRGVLALVGGSDLSKSQFNRATQAKRQPGSSFKPFLYAAALESAKYTPRTKVDDSPEVITDPWSGKTWKPQNFEKDEFAGPITLRKALAESKNTVAVKLLLELGLDKVRAQAVSAGLTSTIPQSYTAALGTGEVGVLEEINAYATIASLGRRADPVLIRKVVASDGGNTIFKADAQPEQGMRPDTAYLTADLMRSVIDDPDGTAHSLSALGRPAAGKTGTASEHRDGWFIGFTPSIAAGAWVGFDDHKMMGSLETGGHCAGPIWLQWMRAANAGQPIEDFPPAPPGVVKVRVNRNTGALAGPDDPFGVVEVFLAGTEPTAEQAAPEQGQNQFYQEQQ